MDALGAYGSDESESDREEEVLTVHKISTSAAADSPTNDIAANNSRKKPRVDKGFSMISPGFLPYDVHASHDSIISWSPDGTGQLSQLHERVRHSLDTKTISSVGSKNQLVLPPGKSCYAQVLEDSKSHEFCNPLLMEQTIQKLGIRKPLGSNMRCDDDAVLEWETDLVNLEEQARIREFQQHQPSETAVSGFAQEQLSLALARNNTQGGGGR
mmetsp:Transcript_13795/g.18005  ORF Transcript_13795/g.18005 Transcript_13795/m.18005 type:complete len:213 (+) Transcript_13795:91-729(+)